MSEKTLSKCPVCCHTKGSKSLDVYTWAEIQGNELVMVYEAVCGMCGFEYHTKYTEKITALQSAKGQS